jgi:hypothetical protein
MTITIKLPDNNKEADFIVELLKKLNVNLVDTADDDAIPEAHKRILEARMDKLCSTPDMAFYSWEDVKKLTAQRKIVL